MINSWKKLISMTEGKKFVIKKVYVPEDEIYIEGNFQLPPMASLSMEDQIFVAAFVKTHGSIKQLESIFNISYPTVKNRLNEIAEKLDIVDVKVNVKDSISSILDKINAGEMDVEEALKELK